MKFETTRSGSVIGYLRKHYPGKWTYSHGEYRRDDGANACKVANGYDIDGEYTGHWSMCIYFPAEQNKAPEWLPFSGRSDPE